MAQIHPSAIVHASAQIGEDVEIGPFTTIEADVMIGARTRVGAYVTLGRRLRLGSEVQVFNYACLGTASQDKKHTGQISRAEIGDRTIVREFVTVNRATREGGVTRIGKNALLMAYAHVAHECAIGDGVVMVNASTAGGEAVIGRGAVLSGLTCVHQFCRIGEFAFVGANSKVTLDIPPYLIADGHPARPFGPNSVGLRRLGFGQDQVLLIRRIYRELFNRDRKFSRNLEVVESLYGENEPAKAILEFCRPPGRGIARPRSRVAIEAFEAPIEVAAHPPSP